MCPCKILTRQVRPGEGTPGCDMRHKLVVRHKRSLVLVFILSIVGLCPAHKVHACINSYGPEPPYRKPIEISELPSSLYVEALQSGSQAGTDDLSHLEHHAREGDYRDQTNYAVALIQRGDFEPAIKILQEVERTKPGEYMTASNLGTVYELRDQLELAKEWIDKGIKRDPKSHAGTEWLHSRILETKLAMKTNSDLLASGSVLGADFGRRSSPALPGEPIKDAVGQPLSMREVQQALEYQLRERLAFVKPPDPIVADLLFALGNVLTVSDHPGHAAEVYALSETYGAADPALVTARKQEASARYLNSLAKSARPADNRTNWLIVGSCAAVSLILLAGVWRMMAKTSPRG